MKNRFQNAFTVCNVALDAVVSDTFGKSASAIIDYLITFDHEICKSFLCGTLKKKADDVISSIEGFKMEDVQNWFTPTWTLSRKNCYPLITSWIKLWLLMKMPSLGYAPFLELTGTLLLQ